MALNVTIESCGFVPVSKEECKGDPGYEFFGFKNQGDCLKNQKT